MDRHCSRIRRRHKIGYRVAQVVDTLLNCGLSLAGMCGVCTCSIRRLALRLEKFGYTSYDLQKTDTDQAPGVASEGFGAVEPNVDPFG